MSIKPCMAFLLTAAMLSSGCLDFGESSPEEQVEQAMQRLEADMGPDGDVKKLNGEMEAEGMSMDMEIEFGSNDATRFEIDAAIFRVIMTCAEGRSFVAFAGDTYESRFDEEMCDMDMEDGPDLSPDADDEKEIVRVDEQEDGSIIAELSETEDGVETRTTIVVRDGRVVEMSFEDDESTGTFLVEYGTRRSISTPEPMGRIPASVSWTTEFTPGTYEAVLDEVDEDVPREEFQVRVLDFDGSILASFPVDTAGQQSEAGFDFEYFDLDDGRLSSGDRFVVEHADWEWEYDYEVVLYDEWAGLTTDENPIPFASGVWIILVLFVVAIGARTRMRG